MGSARGSLRSLTTSHYRLDVCLSPGDLWLNFPNAVDRGALDRIANSV